MTEAYTIEVNHDLVGIVVRQDGEHGFRFHSGAKSFDALDGMTFVKPRDAQRAAEELFALKAGKIERGLSRRPPALS
jgi:hypothetical protein